MKNRVEVRSYVRFQLSQLGARNGAHIFELLCFELARQRHVRNILPATGPVQSGGDQGRDFESYRTALTEAGLGASSFLSMTSDEMVVGACTLQKDNVAGKIRSDLKSIFGSGETPARVIYFCEQNIAVASRHKLLAHCREAYKAELEIFDGEAVADQLADPDTFWIASQFLDIPAELYPQDDTDEAYAELRRRWVTERSVPQNHADFLEIKDGLRSATHEESYQPDLPGWLDVMRAYLETTPSLRFRQKARYEIAVAELRGRGNLDPALPLVEAYFAQMEEAEPLPVDVLDAAVLTTFCWGAILHRHTSLDRQTVRHRADRTRALVDEAFRNVERRGERGTLLEAKAVLTGVPLDGMGRDESRDAMLDAWLRVVETAEATPFFPISHVADFVELTAPVLASRPGYRVLRDRIDELTRVRSGGHAMAEQSERRGRAQLEAGSLCMAIDEFQRAKVGWFSGETLEGSLKIMVLLSECYTGLGMSLAARYYAAGATYLGLHSDVDDIRALTPGAALQLVRTLVAGGEVVSALSMARQALAIHFAFETRPGEIEAHPVLEAVLAESAVGFVIVRRLLPDLIPLTDSIIDGWPIARRDVDQFLALASGKASPWMAMPENELLDRIEGELGRSPLEDVGPVRSHTWSALGVEWTLRYRNDRETSASALGLAAMLQIIQVELAREDLLVIPDSVVLSVELGPVDRPRVDTAGGHGSTWKVVLPRTSAAEDRHGQEEFNEAFSVAATILGQVTALDARRFMDRLKGALNRDLHLRAYSVRPAREMMEFAATQVDVVEDLAAMQTPVLARRIRPRVPDELAWPETVAPQYSAERARELLEKRYQTPWNGARPSLERALGDPRVRELVLGMRGDGLLDWQILGVLFNIICQAQVEAGGRLPMRQLGAAFMARAQRAERVDDPVVDLSTFSPERIEGQRATANASALRVWGLRLNRSDVDLEGVRRLLDVRFRQAVDDVPHDDLFGGPRVETGPPGETAPDADSLEGGCA